jgi:hypothetical protein
LGKFALKSYQKKWGYFWEGRKILATFDLKEGLFLGDTPIVDGRKFN